MPFPELLQVNFQGLDRAERDLDQLKDQLKTLKEKEEYFQTQLASIPTESNDQDRNLLKELKAKLVQLESRYSDKYPDVKKTRMDIAALEKRIALSPPTSRRGEKALTSVADQANNPSYVTLASQLSGVQSDIESVKRQITETGKRREDYVQRTEAGPTGRGNVQDAYGGAHQYRSQIPGPHEEGDGGQGFPGPRKGADG